MFASHFFVLFLFRALQAWTPSLGSYDFPITGSKESQHIFNVGLLASWNFEQDQARTIFEACFGETPMCTWGLSYAYGPFLNHPILSSDKLDTARKYALEAAKESQYLHLSGLEADLIQATSIRYTESNDTQLEGYKAYSAEMAQLYAKYPENADIASLYAESLMDLQCDDDGYHFYDMNGSPLGRTNEIASILESTLHKVSHPFAHHLYIHLMEASGLGKNGTDRAYSSGLALEQNFNLTDAQHFQHMPAHIYLRTGHWYKIVEASVFAVNSDSKYIENEAIPYGPGHNCVFLVYGACMSGMREVAIKYSFHEQDIISEDPSREDDPPYEQAWNTLLTTYIRFGMWNEILNYTKSPPVDSWIFPSILLSYAKGLAYLHQTQDSLRLEKAQNALKNLESLAPTVDPYLKGVTMVALNTLQGILSFAMSDFDNAVNSMRTAVNTQYAWGYNEPPRWHYPSSNCLGEMLLNLKRFEEAEDVFRDEIEKRYLNNPYGLVGLIKAMQGQPMRYKPQDYEIYEVMLTDSWTHSDVGELKSPCMAVDFE